MTIDELEALFAKLDAKLDDERQNLDLSTAPTKRPDLLAFLILDRLVPGGSDIISAAEHDEIWLATDLDKLAAVITEADVLTLIRCGVMFSSDGLHMFA